MSTRKIYLGAGPATLPQSVIDEAAEAVRDYKGSGISILSIAHREKPFVSILEEASSLVLQLCNLGADEYDVLWLQGGGRLQFAMVPMNYLGEGESAGYIDSGHWAHEAMNAAGYFGNVLSLASSAADTYTHLPAWPSTLPQHLQYLHITTNNTIYGTQYPTIPDTTVPLIADMSSDIFSQARDYSKCSLFYAVAQKNLGPAGVTLVVIRRDLLTRTSRKIPDALSYAAQSKAGSMLNTPPVFAIYTSLLVLRWIAARGIENIETVNRKKAELLYKEITRNTLFQSPVIEGSRSMMNVVFTGMDKNIEDAFTAFAGSRNIEGIKGHRSVGGFRASLYNAVSEDDVVALVTAMQDFEKDYHSTNKSVKH
jgi:phosphoserine aminotransferase